MSIELCAPECFEGIEVEDCQHNEKYAEKGQN